MKVTFSERALSEYFNWQSEDKKTLKRINLLFRDIQRSPFEGLGKPEPLKNKDGKWSRRIDETNRIVYEQTDYGIEIYQCKGHYDDK